MLGDYNERSPKKLSNGKKVILFGTGQASRMFLAQFTCDFAYFVDNDTSKLGKTHFNKKIFSPDRLLSEDKENIIVFILSMYYREMRNSLKLSVLLNMFIFISVDVEGHEIDILKSND